MHRGGRWALLFLLALAFLTPAADRSGGRAAAQSAVLSMVSPAACPAGGCAAGQRLNLLFDYALNAYNPAPAEGENNVKVCLYAPSTWSPEANMITTTLTGEVTGVTYANAADCAQDDAPPTGYTRVAALEARISGTAFGDALRFGFRIAATAPSGGGRVLARLFERSAAGTWTRTQQTTTANIQVLASANPAYIASDSGACGSQQPCYINSGEDLNDGLGTGLKDAVDAAQPGDTLIVLGSYTIKSNPVRVNKAVTLTGQGDAVITYSVAGSCASEMIEMSAGGVLRGLNINDGPCQNPGRTLVDIDSSEDVLIESNDLTGGDNAIFIHDKPGRVTVRYNNITGNTGYAVFSEGSAAGGALDIIANNLNNNGDRTLAVECSAGADGVLANRKANHNFWAARAPAASDAAWNATHCAITPAKRLGAPVKPEDNLPGVRAQRFNVTDNRQDAFDNHIAYRRVGGDNFPLYIVDHGYAVNDGVPFTQALGGEGISPCSSFWDVFLEEGAVPGGSLVMYFRYNRSSACMNVINSNQYCGQTTDTTKYPLYWYDPATGATRWWDTTAQRPANLSSGEGQPTSCDSGQNEISVEIDNSGRPSLGTDLNYAPFAVGIPVIRSFVPLASNQTITITWTTNNEPDITGFYVLRSVDGVNFTPLNDLIIPRRGSALSGVTSPAYSLADTGLTNGVNYTYRLQVVRADGTSFYSETYTQAANVATITPTFTASPTRTITVPPPTRTPTRTLVRQNFPTTVPTRTRTPVRVTPSPTFLVLSPRGSRTASPSGLPGESETPGTPGAPPAAGTASLAAGTPIAMVASATPTPSQTASLSQPGSEPAGGEARSPWTWVSLLLGLLSGSAVVAAGGYWLLHGRR